MRFRTTILATAVCAVSVVCAAPAAARDLGFAPPLYVDQSYAGGEPVMVTDPVHHTIVYSSHEGTTHIYRPGLLSLETFQFATEYLSLIHI